MTAQEWLDELERLRKEAIMPPYYLRKRRFFGEDEEEYYVTDKEERIICRMKTMSTEPDNAAYIVAACNAVPRLIDMIEYLAGRLCDEDHGDNDFDGKIQDAFEMTEPKE